jgi:hypothetical protein
MELRIALLILSALQISLTGRVRRKCIRPREPEMEKGVVCGYYSSGMRSVESSAFSLK